MIYVVFKNKIEYNRIERKRKREREREGEKEKEREWNRIKIR